MSASLSVCLCPSLPPPAFGLDSEQPDYDMDSEDETLLNRLNRKMELKPLQFEVMVDRLEKASANQVTEHTPFIRCCRVWHSRTMAQKYTSRIEVEF